MSVLNFHFKLTSRHTKMATYKIIYYILGKQQRIPKKIKDLRRQEIGNTEERRQK